MSIPPLIYSGAMVARERHRADAIAICVLLPIPCALYLLYAVLQPSLSGLTLRRNRISTWEKSEYVKLEPVGPDPSSASDEQALASSAVKSSSERESVKPESPALTKAVLGPLGKAPTLLLGGHEDMTQEWEKRPLPALTPLSHTPMHFLEDDTDDDALEKDRSGTEDAEIEREDVAPTSVTPVPPNDKRRLGKSAIEGPGLIAEGLEMSKPLRCLTPAVTFFLLPLPNVTFWHFRRHRWMQPSLPEMDRWMPCCKSTGRYLTM